MNKTYLVDGIAGDNPKLMARILSDGRDTLFLQYYIGTVNTTDENGDRKYSVKRRKEAMNLFIYHSPKTRQEREHNKSVLIVARETRQMKAREMLARNNGYKFAHTDDMDILTWMRHYHEACLTKDVRMVRQAYDAFTDFLVDPDMQMRGYGRMTKAESKEWALKRNELLGKFYLKESMLNKQMIERFVIYLKNRFNGETPGSIYTRFKKIIKAAVEADILRKNPCKDIKIRIDINTIAKDILSMDEIKVLLSTHYNGENPEIRRAFAFSLYAGVRFCDVNELRYRNIDYSNKLIKFTQSKTNGHSSASTVTIPMSDVLLKIIGEKRERDEKVFKLPSHSMCLKALRHWTERAGIDKHITWHCARHSFAVNILNNGANIKTVASLLGHSGLKHTEKYTRAVDKLKVEAVNSLPDFE